MILNSRPFQTLGSAIGEIPVEITHFRGYHLDFGAPRIDKYGLSIDPSVRESNPQRWQDWLDLVKEKDVKVVWTVSTLKSFANIAEEIDVIQEIDEYCGAGTVDKLQIGGEFWLPKYRTGDTSKKGCYEQVTISDYKIMLRDYIPALQEAFPDKKCFASCASFKPGATSQSEVYRRTFTEEVIEFLNKNDKQNLVGLTFHYYAGAKGNQDGEEVVYTDIDFSFIDEVRLIADRQIIIPEAGWYRGDDSDEQFNKMGQFLDEMNDALEADDLPGLHVLQTPYGGPHAWFNTSGRTIVGNYWADEYFAGAPPIEPTLKAILPPTKRFVIYGKQHLEFTDGSIHKYVVWIGRFKYDRDDIGKPKSFFGLT